MLRDKRMVRMDAEPEVNPMESVGNLVDVMLVLAVGIMIALVAAWNVDLYATTPSAAEDTGERAELDEDYETLEKSDGDSESLEDYGLTEYGTLYQDEDGNLWIVGE
ncbi:MAG: DUF2149 domain-containing protein [Clostridiales bacterium]|nr:DUF2149 domain-containing protein [Clostridiales bacterium]